MLELSQGNSTLQSVISVDSPDRTTPETPEVRIVWGSGGAHKVYLSPGTSAAEMRKLLEHGLRCIRKAIVRGNNIHNEVARGRDA
jgi:hypothetical protein